MSHRRKSAKPTNKLRRNKADASSVSSDSDGDSQKTSNQMLLGAPISRDNGEPQHQADPAPHLALPPDLWHDFQALQAATHLDTASLIRRLISQYGRADEKSQTEEKDKSAGMTERQMMMCGEDNVIFAGPASDPEVLAMSRAGAMTPDYASLAHPLTRDRDGDADDCLVLDLSSGRAEREQAAGPVTPLYSTEDVAALNDAASELPLDLTTCKDDTAAAQSRALMNFFLSQAPEAHSRQHKTLDASSILLSTLAHGLSRSVGSTLTADSHASRLGTTPSVFASSLFNLSGLPSVGSPKRPNASSADKAKTASPAISHANTIHLPAGERSSSSPGKQKIVQHFLSMPGSDLQEEREMAAEGVYDALNADLLKQISLAGAAGVSMLSRSAPSTVLPGYGFPQASLQSVKAVPDAGPRELSHSSSSSSAAQGLGSSSSSNIAQLPAAVTVSSAQGGLSDSALMTSSVDFTQGGPITSAILLDMSGAGLVAGGGLAGLPLMTSAGPGGLVAIPLLHGLSEALAAAAAAAASNHKQQQQQQQQAPGLSPPSVTVDTQPALLSYLQQRHPDLASPVQPQLPPPPPYSAAVAAAASRAAHLAARCSPSAAPASGSVAAAAFPAQPPGLASRAEAASPQGGKQLQGKPTTKAGGGSRTLPRPKAPLKVVQAKDMTLLTENTLFPGVYTSILKLPWSRRSRGKTSAKIKDMLSQCAHESGGGGEDVRLCPNVTVVPVMPCDPSEEADVDQQHPLEEQQELLRDEALPSSESAAYGLLSMPFIMPATAQNSSNPTSSSSSSSTGPAVMMLYQNSLVPETCGKPVRKRGRPPKLPVLSQLLSEKPTDYMPDRQMDERTARVEEDWALNLSFLTSKQHNERHEQRSAAAVLQRELATARGDPVFGVNVKEEPMDTAEALFEASKLFTGVRIAHSASKADSSFLQNKAKADAVRDSQGEGRFRQKLAKMENRHSEVATHTNKEKENESKRGAEPATDQQEEDAEEEMEEQSLESRFDMLANKLSMEISTKAYLQQAQNQSDYSSPADFNTVFAKNPTTSSSSPSSSAMEKAVRAHHQQILFSSNMVEIKQSRRVLNNLIKPSDDCVYTSFRIRPRNCGRRGGRRGGRKSRSSASKGGNVEAAAAPNSDSFNDTYGAVADKAKEDRAKSGSAERVGRVAVGSAVITERIPGAGEVPQRLYHDLYHCRLCGEMLPADNTMVHNCRIAGASIGSPSLQSCDACGTMYLASSEESAADGSAAQLNSLCDECCRRRQSLPYFQNSCPPAVRDTADPSQSAPDGFACQPCGLTFTFIADYIQHRRTAHLEKMARNPRKSRSLRTLPCPARGCPRLFYMQAELARHIAVDHPGELDYELEEGFNEAEGSEAALSQGKILEKAQQDSDSKPLALKLTSAAKDEAVVIGAESEADVREALPETSAQFSCPVDDCQERFPTPLEVLEHMLLAHEDLSSWACPMPNCTRRFGAERHLRVHVLMHKEEKPIQCPFCSYRCRQKNAMAWHVRRHPESAGQYMKF